AVHSPFLLPGNYPPGPLSAGTLADGGEKIPVQGAKYHHSHPDGAIPLSVTDGGDPGLLPPGGPPVDGTGSVPGGDHPLVHWDAADFIHGLASLLPRLDGPGNLAPQTGNPLDGLRVVRPDDPENFSLRPVVPGDALPHHLLHRARLDPDQRLLCV